MSKIGLIIAREYKTRVFKKSFILITLLTPVLLAALMFVPLWLSTIKDDTVQKIAVIDKSGLYHDALQSNETYIFEFSDLPFDSLRHAGAQQDSQFAGILYISGNLATDTAQVILYSDKQAKIETVSYLQGLLGEFVEDQKIAAYNIPNLREMVESSRTEIRISTIKWNDKGEEQESSAELALMIGMISALVIYMFIFIYGAQVMSGVVQEKTNRIIEVIVSSVKPFELMMGKIIGVALVGLTQMLLWVVLTLALSTALGGNLMAGTDMAALTEAAAQTEQSAPATDNMTAEILNSLAGYDFTQLLIMFVLYFLGGYLLYASLFAAVGSAVESETDTNQFTLPLSIPIIFALYAAIYSVQNPDGPLAFWCSLIPFTSPIVMLVRIPFGVPVWQLIVSLGILVLSFAGTTWMAGKIYRTGILMYGKKSSWKEMWKWLTYSAKRSGGK